MQQFIYACKLVSLGQNTTLPLNRQTLQNKANLPLAKMMFPRVNQMMGPGRGMPQGGRGMMPQNGMMPGRGMPQMMAGRGRGMPGAMPGRGRGMMSNMMPGGPGRGVPPQQQYGMQQPQPTPQPNAPPAASNPAPQAPEKKEEPSGDIFASLLTGSVLAKKKEKTPEPVAPQPTPVMPMGGMMGMSSGGMMGGSAPAPAANALSDFGPGPTDPKREPVPSGPSASNYEASFSETSKLRAQLRAAEEMERRAKKDCTELRTRNDDLQREMDNAREQMQAFQQQAQQCMMEANQAKQQVAPLMAENQQLREGVGQWQEQCNRQQAEIERLNEEIVKLQDKVEKLSDVERSQNTFQERVAEAEKRAMNAEEQMAATERELFAVKRERDALKADVAFYSSKASSGPPPTRITPVVAPSNPEPAPAPPVASSGGWDSNDLDLGFGAPPVQESKPKPRLLTKEEIDAFKVGDKVIRKGEECTITKIDHFLQPPSCTVKLESGRTVETELHLVQRVVPTPAPVASMPAPSANSSEGFGGFGDFSAPMGRTAPKIGEPSPMTQPVSNPPVMLGAPKVPTQPPVPVAAPAPVPVPAPKPVPASTPGLLPLNQEAINMYEEYFTQADANGDGMVDGPEAFQFFSKSSLPRKSLAAIWTLIDNPKKGKLSKAQFFSMFHIVMSIKQNPQFKLPKQLPDVLRPETIEAMIPKKEPQPAVADDDDWDNFDAGF